MKRLTGLIIAFLLALPVLAVAQEGPEIARARFCTGIADHEPVDAPEALAVGQQTAFFFTEILNAADQVITHRWYYNDIEIATVDFKIGADRWRTWSSKQTWHLTPGTLKVQVTDAAGQVLAEKSIAIE